MRKLGKSKHPEIKQIEAQVAGNIFTDIYHKVIKPAYEKVIVPVHDFAKKNKLVSKGLRLIPDKRAQAAAEVADKIGYGKKRRHHKKQSGGRKHKGGHPRAILI